MITYVSGDIFTSPADALVNPVNVIGIMGAGLAKEFKLRYPDMYIAYRHACLVNTLRIGVVQFYKDVSGKYIINFPTKHTFAEKSFYSYIEIGMSNLVFSLNYPPYDEIKSISFPKLGCGLGGLSWDRVKPIFETHLSKLDLDIYIYN